MARVDAVGIGGWWVVGQGLRSLQVPLVLGLSSAFCLCPNLMASSHVDSLKTEAPEPPSAPQFTSLSLGLISGATCSCAPPVVPVGAEGNELTPCTFTSERHFFRAQERHKADSQSEFQSRTLWVGGYDLGNGWQAWAAGCSGPWSGERWEA